MQTPAQTRYAAEALALLLDIPLSVAARLVRS